MLVFDHVPFSQPAGSREFGPAAVADGAASIALRIARCTSATPTLWPNAATIVSAQLYVSLDGGQTWQESTGFPPTPGGIFTSRAGAQATESWVTCPLQPGTGRQVKLTVTVTGPTLSTRVTVEVN